MRIFLKTVSFMMCTLLAKPMVAQEALQGPSVVIVPKKARGAPNLMPQLRRRVERALKAKADVVRFPMYRRAAKRAGFKGRDVFSKEAAPKIGAEADVTHVCIIESQAEKIQGVGKRKKRIFFAEVTLIKVSKAESVFQKRYELWGRKITAAIGAAMVSDLLTEMNKPDAPPEPEPELVPPEPPPPPKIEEPKEVEQVSAEVEMPPEEPPAPEPPPEPEPVVEEPAPPPEPTPEDLLKLRHRAPVVLRVGGVGMQRKAIVRAKGLEKENRPKYKGPLPGGTLHLDVYPLGFAGTGKWLEGFGMHVDATYMYGQAEMEQADGTKELIKSDVIAAQGGASFRYVFWNSLTAPDFVARVGYAYRRFPVGKGSFPGINYSSVYVGGTLTFPILEQISVMAGGSVEPLIMPAKGVKKSLGKKKSALGYSVEGGVVATLGRLELLLLGRMEQTSWTFKGETDLRDMALQYNNAKLEDTSYGGSLMMGYRF